MEPALLSGVALMTAGCFSARVERFLAVDITVASAVTVAEFQGVLIGLSNV